MASDGIVVDGVIARNGTLVDGTLGGTLDRSRGARSSDQRRGRQREGEAMIRAGRAPARVVARPCAIRRMRRGRRGGSGAVIVAVGEGRGVFGTVEHSEDAPRYARASGSASSAPRLANACASVGLPSAPSLGTRPRAGDERLGGRGVGSWRRRRAPRGVFHAAGRREDELHLVRRDDTRAENAALGGVERLADVDGEIFGRREGREREAGRASLAVAVAPGRAPASFGSCARRYGSSSARAPRSRRRRRPTRSRPAAPRGCPPGSAPCRPRRWACWGRASSGLASSRSKRLRSARSSPRGGHRARGSARRAPRRTRARVERCPVARAEENQTRGGPAHLNFTPASRCDTFQTGPHTISSPSVPFHRKMGARRWLGD